MGTNRASNGDADKLYDAKRLCLKILGDVFDGVPTTQIRNAWSEAVKVYKALSDNCGEPAALELDGLNVSKKLSLDDLDFPCEILITRSAFEYELYLGRCTFEAPLSMAECRFCKGVLFANCDFAKDVFIEKVICQDLIFQTVNIAGRLVVSFDSPDPAASTSKDRIRRVEFDATTINGATQVQEASSVFCHATASFIGEVTLHRVLLGTVICNGAQFAAFNISDSSVEKGSFISTKFNGAVEIDAMCGRLSFDNARFEDRVSLFLNRTTEGVNTEIPLKDARSEVSVHNEVSCNETIFCSSLNAKDTVFVGPTTFRGSVFKGEVFLSGARFKSDASFEAIVAERPVILTGVEFKTIPNFLDARLTYPLLFNRVWNSKRVPIAILQQGQVDAPERFDALAAMAGQAGDLWWQQEFVARSFQSSRACGRERAWPFIGKTKKQGGTRWNAAGNYWLGLLYELSSDYGRSVVRPLLVLLIISVLVTGILGLLLPFNPAFRPPGRQCANSALEHMVELSFISLKSGFFLIDNGSESIDAIIKCSKDEAKAHGIWLTVSFVSYLQRFVSAVLWILLGIGIRFRLRMK
jgi:hypothetical protein